MHNLTTRTEPPTQYKPIYTAHNISKTMPSFRTHQNSQYPSVLNEISSISAPPFSRYRKDLAGIYKEQVDCDDDPIPLHCAANFSLLLEPLTFRTETTACRCQFSHSENHKTLLANEPSEPALIRTPTQSDTSANEVLDRTASFGRRSNLAAYSLCGLNEHDVVCSRGKVFYNLPGNIRFRKTVRAYIPMYLAASSKTDKSAIIDGIIDATVIVDVINGSTRFLKYHPRTHVWSVMRYDQVRDKVGHALREAAYDMERESKIKSSMLPKKLTRW